MSPDSGVVLMLKSIGVFLLTLLLSGVGLTLYLPEYSPAGTTAASFQIIENTLQQAVEADTYLASSLVFDSAADKPPPQGLQLGIFGTLLDAQGGARQLSLRALSLPLVPSIFKASHDSRIWYVLALGPFTNTVETRNIESLLLDNDVRVQTIYWPTTDETNTEK